MKISLTLSPFLVATAVVIATGGFIEHCKINTIAFEDLITITDLPDSDDYNFFYTPILSAICKGPHGKYVNSTLDLNHCLENRNATLVVGSLCHSII